MKVSVVIPSLNSEKEFAGCLATLIPQLRKGDEVIIIDGGSRDRTLQMAIDSGCEIYLFPEASLGECRNFGTQLAKNDIVLQTDTDVEFVPDFFDRLRSHYEDPAVVGVTGGWRDGKNRPLGNFICQLIEGTIHYADCLCSYTKDAYYRTLGHPDVSFGEQIGMWMQLQRLGPTVYDPEMYVIHYTERNVNIPSYLIGSAILGSAAVYEGVIGGDLGYAALGHGAGWLAGQAGVDMGINKELAGEPHFHHWMLGVMLAAAGMTFSEVLPSEIEYGLYGFGSGLFLHDILTESYEPPQ